MVEILTHDGIYLDLDPEADFEITIDNPIFDDDTVPVPFSTSIAFLPTPVNKQAFGYLDAMMLAPEVKSIAASIIIKGVPLFSGTLIYDSIDEDGRINYTFSASDFEDLWSKKIHELTGYPGTVSDDYGIEQWREDFFADRIPGIHPPIVMSASLVAETASQTPSGENGRPFTTFNRNGKFGNFPKVGIFSPSGQVVPAFELQTIMQRAEALTVSPDTSRQLSMIILFGTEGGRTLGPHKNFPASTLPDVTLVEFIQAVCHMICAFVFTDGSGCRIVSFDDIDGAQAIDWDRKISDIYSCTAEEAENYELLYSEDEDNKISGTLEEAKSLSAVFDYADTDEYTAVRHLPTKDTFSLKKNIGSIRAYDSASGRYTIQGSTDEILIDRLNPSEGMVTNSVRTDKVRSIDIGFTLSPSAPVSVKWTYSTNPSRNWYIARMMPVISFSASANRSKDMYISIYGNGQAGDNGVVFASPDTPGSADATIADPISAEALFERHHMSFAAWLATDRQVIIADLNLSIPDIASFRMWQPVMIRDRRFIVRKLALRMLASSDSVASTGELVSL